jgi:protein-disulfide isomerase
MSRTLASVAGCALLGAALFISPFAARPAHAQTETKTFFDWFGPQQAKPAKAVKRHARRPAKPHVAAPAPRLTPQTLAPVLGEAIKSNPDIVRGALLDLLRNDREVAGLIARAVPPSGPQAQPAPKQETVIAGNIQRSDIETIIKEYLLKHPEVIQEAMEELESRQTAAKAEKAKATIKEAEATLFRSPRQVVLGNPGGDVTMVEFFDYNCGFCKHALVDMMNLMKADPKLRVVLKEFPVLGRGSVEAAQVAVAVRMQDPKKYFEFHQKLLGGRGQADKARAIAVAKEVGLDTARIEKDMNSDEVKATLEESMKLAEPLGLNGTPSYVIGSDIVVGAVGHDALKGKINQARCGKATC